MAGNFQIVGLASGLDTSAIITSLVNTRLAANVKRQAEVTYLDSKVGALNTLNTKISDLNGALAKLKEGGVQIFQANSSNANVVAASVGTGASAANYNITVEQLAKNANGSFEKTFSNGNDKVSTTSGTLSIAVGAGANTVNFEINEGTSIADLVSQINSTSELKGKVSASLVNVGTNANPEYKIMLTSLKEGLEDGELNVSFSAGLEAEFGGFNVVQAQNAKFKVEGISGLIEKSTNVISDVFQGITMTLGAVGNTRLNVRSDNSSSAALVKNFVDKFNDIVKFSADGNKVTVDGSNAVYGALAKTQVDDNFISQFRSELSSATASDGNGLIRKLSELGITTNRDGTLNFDEKQFNTAINSDNMGAISVLSNFANSVTGFDGLINNYTKFQGIIGSDSTSTTSRISAINKDINRLISNTESYREALVRQFAHLETIIGKMQAASNTISSYLNKK